LRKQELDRDALVEDQVMGGDDNPHSTFTQDLLHPKAAGENVALVGSRELPEWMYAGFADHAGPFVAVWQNGRILHGFKRCT
jgi:hypothetical protein